MPSPFLLLGLLKVTAFLRLDDIGRYEKSPQKRDRRCPLLPQRTICFSVYNVVVEAFFLDGMLLRNPFTEVSLTYILFLYFCLVPSVLCMMGLGDSCIDHHGFIFICPNQAECQLELNMSWKPRIANCKSRRSRGHSGSKRKCRSNFFRDPKDL